MEPARDDRAQEKDYFVLSSPFAELYDEIAEALANYPGIEVVVARGNADPFWLPPGRPILQPLNTEAPPIGGPGGEE